MMQSLTLIEEAKRCLSNLDSTDTVRLASISKNITISLDHSVNSLPGHQDVDSTIENINETLQILSMGEFPSTTKSYGYIYYILSLILMFFGLKLTLVILFSDNYSKN